jgi:hypothetical protein
MPARKAGDAPAGRVVRFRQASRAGERGAVAAEFYDRDKATVRSLSDRFDNEMTIE